MVTHGCNLSTQKAEAGSRVQGQARVYSKTVFPNKEETKNDLSIQGCPDPGRFV